MTTTVKNPQKWPGGPNLDWFWGSPKVKSATGVTIALIDSGVDNSNNQFGGRLLTQVDFTAPGRARLQTGAGTGRSLPGSRPVRASTAAPRLMRTSSR